MSINRVTISGNLTRDAEMRTTGSGTTVISFGVAVNDRRKNSQTGEWEDYPNYIDCTMFGTRAASLQRYLTKGTKVCVEGKLRYSKWEREGQTRSKIEVIVDDLDFMSSRSSNAQQAYAQQPAYAPAPTAGYGSPAATVYGASGYAAPAQPAPAAPAVPTVDTSTSAYDEDIPF